MNSFKSLIAALVGAALLVLSSTPVMAQNPPIIQFPHQGDMLAGVGAQLIASNSSVLITNLSPVPIKPGRGIALFPVLSGSAATTSNVVINLGASPWTNGTTSLFNGPGIIGPGTTSFFTNSTLSFTNALNGTNQIFPFILIPASNLDNCRMLNIMSASSTATNAGGVNFLNLYWFYYSQQ